MGPAPDLGCPGCGAADAHGLACQTCLNLGSPLSQLLSFYQYESITFQKVLRAYKERGLRLVLPHVLSRLTDVNEHLSVEQETAVVPIPASKKRLQQLGWNHTLPVASHLAGVLGCCLADKALVLSQRSKSGASAAQKTRSIQERRLALKDTFMWQGRGSISPTVILVDDVTTTLATLETAAQTCLDAGAKRVIGVVLAHTALTSG